jgi:hypothetical protein
MGAAVELAFQGTMITCCHERCGFVFAVPAWWESKRREDHSSWYCPNGHSQAFKGKTEAERLKEEKAALERQLAAEKANRSMAENRERAAKAQATKYRRHAEATACPAGCGRTFATARMQKHLKSKHPGYALEAP